jgi:serine/threonine protein phosphatase 1
LPEGRRVYAIGDVHGRSDLFEQLLAMIETDHRGRAAADADLVLLGDLVDRGPDSRGVVERAMTTPAWARQTTLMGNHEEIMLQVLDGARDQLSLWLKVGGRETLASWGVDLSLIEDGTISEILDAAHAAIPASVVRWLMGLRQSLSIGDYFFVHAGVRPGVPLDRQDKGDSFWIREEFLASSRHHGAMIVHGHSIATEVDWLPNRIGIDTGAYATGRLTALCLERDEQWFLQT